jgi:ribosomal RNA-processing protein 12
LSDFLSTAIAYAAPDNGDAAAVMKLDDGGLQRMFACILAGVASQSPRMTSASVMALARLLFEFSAELQLPAAMLLPSLCALLRSKAREVVKSVLGFLKVASVRLPADVLQQHLPTIIEGLLIWAQDSKNKFKMKVRRLLERLCKRCGYEAVAAAWPEGTDPKLLSSIRKGLARSARDHTARKIASDGEVSEGPSEMSRGKKTLSGSKWRHTQIFSDEGNDAGVGEDGDARSRAGQSLARSAGGRRKGAPGVLFLATCTHNCGSLPLRKEVHVCGRAAAALGCMHHNQVSTAAVNVLRAFSVCRGIYWKGTCCRTAAGE